MDAIEKMYNNIMQEMDEYNEANKAAAQLSTEDMIKFPFLISWILGLLEQYTQRTV